MSSAAPCLAFSAPMTLPMSFAAVRAGRRDRFGNRRLQRVAAQRLRQEFLDHRDLRLFLRGQLLAPALAVQSHRIRGGI